jgi:hypothetical protein
MLDHYPKTNDLDPAPHENHTSGIIPAVRGPLELFSSAVPLELLAKIPLDLSGSNVKETAPKNNAGLCGKLGLRAVFDPSAGALLVILGMSLQITRELISFTGRRTGALGRGFSRRSWIRSRRFNSYSA